MSDFEDDLFGGKKERDEAMRRALEHAGGSWLAAAMAYVRSLQPGWEGTGERIRLDSVKAGVPEPHHHNDWGALILHAQRRHMLIKTGRWVHMRAKKAHARLTPVLRRI